MRISFLQKQNKKHESTKWFTGNQERQNLATEKRTQTITRIGRHTHIAKQQNNQIFGNFRAKGLNNEIWSCRADTEKSHKTREKD